MANRGFCQSKNPDFYIFAEPLGSKKVYHFSRNCNILNGQGCPDDSIVSAISGKEILVSEFLDPKNNDWYVLFINKDLYNTELLEIVLREPDKYSLSRVMITDPNKLQEFGTLLWSTPSGYQLTKVVPKK